jgi:hypothetical protein
MKKYYLHIGTENTGPFDLEELKIKRITKKTPVWFEGMENWKYAEDIEELKSVFVVTPPPIDTFKAIESAPLKKETVKVKVKEVVQEEEEVDETKILGLSKNSFFMVITVVLLFIGTFIFNTYQENRDSLLEKRNHKTDIENNQYVIQQKQIEEQKIALAEQERLEAERLNNEKKQTDNNRLIEIQNLISLTTENLENAKIKTDEASSFKFFRTTAEKNEQLEELKNEINAYLNQIEKLKKESNQLNLELEKIK